MAKNPTSQVIQHLRRVFLQDDAGPTDGQLLGSFIESHDDAALAALVKRHGRLVWNVCRRLLDQHDAEDAFQATFLVLCRKATSIRHRERVASWLYGVAHQTALQARRAAARRRAREKQVVDMPESTVVEQDLWNDLQPLLDQELSRLPEKYQVVLLLCDMEGKTRKEAARQLGLPEGTVASRLTRARAMLAKRLARHGLAMTGGTLAAVLSEKATSACVPTSLLSSTIKGVTLIATGQAAAIGVISSTVAALTEGVLKTMLLTKLKTATAGLLLVAALSSGAGLIYQTQAAEQSKVVRTMKADKEKPPAAKDHGPTGSIGLKIKAEPEDGKFIVLEVLPDSPAAKAGLQAGDILIKVGDVEIKDKDTLAEAVKKIYSSKPGDEVQLQIERKVKIKVGKWPPRAADAPKKKDEAINEELKRLEGTWREVAVELGGKEMDREDIGPNNLLVFSEGKCSLISGAKKERKIECTFTIDPTKNPKWMDTTRISDKVSWPGIYELKGDTLKVFFGSPGGKRPTEFKTRDGTQEVIHTYRRIPQR